MTRELPALVEAHFPVLRDARGIFGHSMGGHGALALALRNPDRYRSVSAFAPIVAPSQVPWGQQGVRRLPRRRPTRPGPRYDACALVRARPLPDRRSSSTRAPADKFLDAQLKPELFEAACADAGQPLAAPAPRRLRPQLLLHRHLRRRPPRAPRARAGTVAAISP